MARRSRPVLYEVVRRGERQRQASWLSRLISSLRGSESPRYTHSDDDQLSEDIDSPAVQADTADEADEQHIAAPERAARSSTRADPTAAESRPSHAVESHEVSAPALRRSAEAPRVASRPDPTPLLSFPAPRQAEGEPWQITLKRSSLLAAAFGVVILMLISFEIGQHTAGPRTPSDGAQTEMPSGSSTSTPARTPTRYVPPTPPARQNNTAVALPERPTPRDTAEQQLQPTTQGAVESVPHGRYLVVQNLGVQRKRDQRIPDGQRIVAHLAAKGIPAKLIQPGRKPPHVIVATPLDGMSPAAIENIKARVRRAGNDFADYTFKDCYETSF